MYSVDKKDSVIELNNAPQSSVGAPCPVVFATEHTVHIAYYIEDVPKGWDGSTLRVVDEYSSGESVALVNFKWPYAHMFGPPNDEAFDGHPLASRGLHPYGIFEVVHSSWIRGLERMNSVHPYHQRAQFAEYRHFVFAFHDSTFECVAHAFTVSVHAGSVVDVVQLALRT
jgi:hypothetical protein